MSADTSVERVAGAGGSTNRWITIGAVAAAVVLAVAAAIYFIAAPKLVKGDKLAGLLVSDQQLSAIVGASMKSGNVADAGAPTAGGLSKAQCLSALNAAQELSYTDTGYTDLRWSEARDNPEHVQHYVVQAVAAFPDAGRADAFVANATAMWRLCADQVVVTVLPGQAPLNWRTVGVIGVPPKVSIAASREDLKWTCQRALRAAVNVVVDVVVCADDVTDQGRRLGDEIAAQVTH